MVVEEGTGNGEGTECGPAVPCSKSDAVNGFAFGIGNGFADGFLGEVSGDRFQTYKRRKQAKLSPESKLVEDGRVSGEAASELADQTVKERWDMVLHNDSCEKVSLPVLNCHAILNSSDDCPHKRWRNAVLEHVYQSLSDSEGGIKGCIQDALVFHPEIGCTTTNEGSVHFHEDKHKCPSTTGILNGSQNAGKGHVGVMSNGSLNESNHQTITELCQRVFYNIIISEKFALLCKLLFENFQGIKVDSFFDFSLINSRMKEGAYESSPMLFSSDIQQVWRRLQRIGTDMVSLAKSLSDVSRTSYREQVGGSVHSTSEEGKHEFSTLESDWRTKPEKTEACGVYKVCTCRHCGGKADGRDCLVCDSCEEMYHVSCVEPAVKEIPSKSWYCANCTANGIESPHENCVVCERLNAPRALINGIGDDIILTNEETPIELEESSNHAVEDGLQLLKGGKNSCFCNMCGSEVENGEKFWVCGHALCPHKYYHVRCLTSKQLKLYGPCWYCPSCLCRACLIDRDDDQIVLCDGCDYAYHIYCMEPRRSSIPRGKWFCRKCDAGFQEIRKAKRAYENLEKKQNKKGGEGKRTYENLEKKPKKEGDEVLDKAEGGVDMLLTAADTLNYEEKLASKQMKS